MKKLYEFVKDNPLFNDIDYNNFEKIFKCLGIQTQEYEKDNIILMTGEKINFLGLILSGSVRIIKEDVNGNASILANFGPTELYGEVFACTGIDCSPVTVQASEKCEILLIKYKKIITLCPYVCSSHTKLIKNMLGIIARKNLMLNQKIEILSKRTIREKLLMFFDTQRGCSKKFTVPFNREEMAHYLCVDRSALSNELCKMRDNGLIRFNKNEFEII